MKLVLLPEPAPWLEPLLAAIDSSKVRVVSPESVVPGFSVLRRVMRKLAVVRGAGADLALKLELRRLMARLVAAWLPAEVTHVFAPSCCAQPVFARAARAERVLINDLPLLRMLHADLDEAATAVPEATFLRNFRAPTSFVVQQEQEHVLASRVLVSSRRVRARLRQRLPADRIGVLPLPQRSASLVHDASSPFVLLAGTTASRHGLELALRAIEGVPHTQLVARRGPGSADGSLRHPQLRLVEGGPLSVRAVVAPSWVECFSPEVEVACRVGIPVLATERALGWVEPGRSVHAMRAGDLEALRTFLHPRVPTALNFDRQ